MSEADVPCPQVLVLVLEAAVLRETLLRHRKNKSRAAEEFGLSHISLRSKLDRYGVDDRKLDSCPAGMKP